MNISSQIVVLIAIFLAVTFPETKAIKSLGLFDMSRLSSASVDHSDSILRTGTDQTEDFSQLTWFRKP